MSIEEIRTAECNQTIRLDDTEFSLMYGQMRIEIEPLLAEHGDSLPTCRSQSMRASSLLGFLRDAIAVSRDMEHRVALCAKINRLEDYLAVHRAAQLLDQFERRVK